MNISDIKPNDIIRCDVRGERFYAIVEKPVKLDKELNRRVMLVSSLRGSIPARLISARQVVSHWRKSPQSKH